jgi:hypothetical protein
MSEKRNKYNTILSLIEEELYLRNNPENYNDNQYDATNKSLREFHDLDISLNDSVNKFGGGYTCRQTQTSSINTIPGKLDVIRNSFHVPLDVAIKGTHQRQLLFAEENK